MFLAKINNLYVQKSYINCMDFSLLFVYNISKKTNGFLRHELQGNLKSLSFFVYIDPSRELNDCKG